MPVIDRFHRWLEGLASQVVPQSRLGGAAHYTLGLWPKLTIFLKHGEVPLDNNRCGNAIRPFAVGREGWLFSDTVAGGPLAPLTLGSPYGRRPRLSVSIEAFQRDMDDQIFIVHWRPYVVPKEAH